ncbi:MAG: hypothetical protein DME65_07125 [Verrucomicrobia bacterium]|nr:MAG: hypothetical protein DME65_07125 [Verrucomicrobiota bacterium]
MSSFTAALITGFATSFRGGLLVQGIQVFLSILSLATIVAAFFFYGWKIGVMNFFVVFTAANIGASLFQNLVKKSRCI